jgi:hypothetical protein
MKLGVFLVAWIIEITHGAYLYADGEVVSNPNDDGSKANNEKLWWSLYSRLIIYICSYVPIRLTAIGTFFFSVGKKKENRGMRQHSPA